MSATSNYLEGAKVLMVRRNRIRPFPGQPRTFFDQTYLEALAKSIATVGQKVPIIVRRITGDPGHDYELVDGQQRWHACGMIGKDSMIAIVTELDDPEDQFTSSMVANYSRSPHTVMDTAHALKRMLVSGRTEADIAAVLGRSQGWVSKHLCILRLCPEVQQLLDPTRPKDKRLSFTVAYLLSELPPERQVEAARVIESRGMLSHEARTHVRLAAVRLGVQRGRTRTRSDEARKLMEFLQRVERDARIFLAMPRRTVAQLFAHRKPEDAEKIGRAMDEAIARLTELRDVVKRDLPAQRESA
ncbi:MAG: ParB/RepB/Spo0J family partition protein [Candidatus Aenigmarchaeota archaeon]|nr:ParB/RepB/Spo0J family partition protein [Candidatus Aenigmarchaeota archaeon]